MEELLASILVELRAIRSALDTQNIPVKAEYYRQLASGPLSVETIKQHNSSVLKRQKQRSNA